jgi:hypothetical protein
VLTALLLVWIHFTLPAFQGAGDMCTQVSATPERSLYAIELHGSPQWLGYEFGPRQWPGLRDSLLAMKDIRGRDGQADSIEVNLSSAWAVWSITVDLAGNRSCESAFMVASPELSVPMPAAWPFRTPFRPALRQRAVVR